MNGHDQWRMVWPFWKVNWGEREKVIERKQEKHRQWNGKLSARVCFREIAERWRCMAIMV